MKTDAKPQPNARVSGCCGSSAPRTPRAADGDAVREMVRDGYARVALDEHPDADAKSRQIGYSDEQLEAVPEGANLGVGCGNPTAIDSLRTGEVVVDLGSGAGFDAFLAARAVGPGGRVIGVDMTDEMLEKARANAGAGGFDNVEFRKGYIEDLPIDDASVDVIISNCVINLSPDKPKVYAEAYRVLRPGGRVMVSDVVLDRPLPEAILGSVEAYVGCVGGAVLRDEYLATIRAAGFGRVEVTREASVESFFSLDDPSVRDAIAGLGITEEQARGYVDAVRSVHVLAVK